MKLEKNCEACRIEQEINETREDRTLTPEARVTLIRSSRKRLEKTPHTCRNPRSNRTREA